MIDIEKHIENLPDPTTDIMPPRVGFTTEGALQAERDRMFKMSLLDTKKHTETYAKRILEGPLFMGHFRKDGDWVTLPGGRQVFQKKVSDLIGSVPILTRPNAHTFVEIKGVSPHRSFAFSRLDKRTNKRQPSQHEKLTKEMERDNLVWLFIGWWDSDMPSIAVQRGGRHVAKWYKKDAVLTGTLLRWQDWIEIYATHKYRSIRQKDRPLLDDYRITKVAGRWTLDNNHWWAHGYY